MSKLLSIICLCLALTACNTFYGFRKDMDKLGEKIEDGVGHIGKSVDKLDEKLQTK